MVSCRKFAFYYERSTCLLPIGIYVVDVYHLCLLLSMHAMALKRVHSTFQWFVAGKKALLVLCLKCQFNSLRLSTRHLVLVG